MAKKKIDKNSSLGALYCEDSLNRLLPSDEQVGAIKKDRYVACFYFVISGAYGRNYGVNGTSTAKPLNITELEKNHPEALKDFSHPAWRNEDGTIGRPYWAEPLFGYYFQDDKWVLRRHVKMLTMAGIDFLVFDTTNYMSNWHEVSTLLEVLDEFYKDGWNVPKVAYYTNSRSGERVNEIWNDLYKPNLFEHLWFKLDGKPFIIADPDECTKEQQEFFTFRLPQWPIVDKKQGGCPWIDFARPQDVWKDENGNNDIVSVSVAQHPTLSFSDTAFYGLEGARGRSYHNYKNDYSPEAIMYGYNVAEQWERALELDPRIVFFTGWNEWAAGIHHRTADNEHPILMVDNCDWEFSRDSEPMKNGHFDNYYLQLCDYVRRYKGAPKSPKKQGYKTIDFNGDFSEWDKAEAVYYNMPYGTIPREHEGHGGVIYKDDTGRNEFDCLKVAHDKENIYFYAKTREKMNYTSIENCMSLLISVANRPYEPHWHGYQYLINENSLNKDMTFVKKSLGGYRFANGKLAPSKRNDYEIMFSVKREDLGIIEDGFELRFKWIDHTCLNQTIEDLYLHGDTAPYGRFSFVYKAE